MAMMMSTRMTILRVRKAIKGVWVVVPFDCYLSVLDLFSFITLSYLYLYDLFPALYSIPMISSLQLPLYVY